MAEGNDPINKSPGSGLDTGTGGFPIGESETRITYDIGTEDDAPLERSKWSPGQIKVDNRKKDISRSTKSSLSAYLSDTTLGKTPSSPSSLKNSFPVNQVDGLDPVDLSLKDAEGYAENPDITLNVHKNVNIPSVYVDPKNLQSLSSKSQSATNLKIIKGRQNPKGNSVDGHSLLKDATTDISGITANPQSEVRNAPGNGYRPPASSPLNDKSPIKNYYGNPGVSNSVIYNRFNPDNKQADYFFNSIENAGDLQIGPEDLARLRQEQFALKYEKGTSNADRTISFGKLAQIGTALTKRAGLEAETFFGEGGGDPSGPVASVLALQPGEAQLGAARVERERLTARSVLEEAIGESIEANVLINPLGKSWGSMNNPLDEYAGMSNFGMQILAAALASALGFIFFVLTLVLKDTGTNTMSTVSPEGSIRPYGAYQFDKDGKANYGSLLGIIDQIRRGKFSFLKLLGIQPTTYPIDQCLGVGSLAFFGIISPNASMSTASGEAKTKAENSVIQSPGYYSVLARSVNRSFLQVSDAFVKLGRASAINPIDAIKQLMSLVQTLRESRFMTTIGVFSSLGDRIISFSSASEGFVYDESKFGPGVRFVSKIDLQPDTSGGKSRQGRNETIALAWSSYTSKYTLINYAMPGVEMGNNSGNSEITSLLGVTKDEDLGVPSFIARSGRNGGDPYVTPGGPRIKTEDREEIERVLEAEYVPFYMHDVRTNEVLGFHAFLTSLTDDYTVNYDSLEGFGRVEPVKVYKGTTRKIGLSFIVAATSHEDFDAMWLKINKLVTMIYPQFTEGRRLISGDYSIYAPFSQNIGASPLIRLRVGDLISSNYSKFNLARIFGYTYAGTKFAIPAREPEPPVDPVEQQAAKNRSAAADLIKKNILKPGFTFKSNAKLNKPVFEGEDIVTAGISRAAGQTDLRIGTNPELELPKGYVLKVVKVIVPGEGSGALLAVKNPGAVCVVERAQGLDRGGFERRLGNTAEQYYSSYEGPGGDQYNILNKKYFIDASELIPTPSTKRSIVKTDSDEDDDPPAAEESQQVSVTSTNSLVDELGAQELHRVKGFMNDNPESANGNAVVRSFRSSGGKGLAGFIDSLSFDWYDNVTWTTDEGEGRKAPKMCKVTLSFTPIHDITPGLDHMGSNRAPVYPVGPLSIPSKITQ